MKFETVATADAAGWIAAHSVRAGDVVLRKGALISSDDVARLVAAGLRDLVAVRLEPGDIDENAAAEQLGRRLAGQGIRCEAPFTGRVNLFATQAGVLTLDVRALEEMNRVDEAITVATLPAMRAVVAGEMVATVKIIPYAVPGAVLEAALAHLPEAPVALSPYRVADVAVISTLLPALKSSVVDKTLRIMSERLAPAAASVCLDRRVPHAVVPLASAIAEAAKGPGEIIVVFGASAITDRRDVVPSALLAAGGEIEHLGMPVDPGNLLLLGRLGGKPVLGAPGCARSPKENGFDWVLQRLLAGVSVARADIQAMGVGGLLMEIVSRPQPRAPGHEPGRASGGGEPFQVAGIVLAAGRSTRMGERNKLLQPVRGEPLIRHAVEAAVSSGLSPVVVVTGHQSDQVEAALIGLPVRFVHNAAFADGLSGSLKTGIAAVPKDAAGAVILLGDMPNVTGEIISRLMRTFDAEPERLAVVPTVLGQRGNPVLLARALFPRIAALSGDEGARRLLMAAGEAVEEIALDDPAIAIDVDTPEALAALRAWD